MKNGKSLKLLYLEADPVKHDLLEEALKPLQYETHFAVNGRDALEQIAKQPFDMLAISTAIPRLSTLEFIDTILRWPRSPSILVMTKPGDEAIAAEALKHGAANYMIVDDHKAWLTLLPIVIRQIMRRHQLENEKRDMLFTLQDRNRALSYLNLVGADLTSILEPEQIMKRLMRYAIEILGAEGSSIWLWTDEDQTHLECKAVIHRTSVPPLKGMVMPIGEGIVGWTAQENKSSILNQVDTDHRFDKSVDDHINFSTMALLAVPLRVQGDVVGVLEFVNKLVGDFDDNDQSLAETLAHSAATALENAQLIESLRQSTAVLQERNAELDAFGHTVAHDLQNMLARIIGFSEFLLMETNSDETATVSNEMVVRAADVIAKDGRKMSKVIEALMLLSAVRQAEVKAEALDMKYLVEEAIGRLSERVEEKKGTIIYPEEWPLAAGYGPWIEEVWYNYLGNALKYGGEPPEIELGATITPDQKMIKFWVKDKGQGVSKEVQKDLFKPFADYARKRPTGAGLGLSIVLRIMKRLNGTVGVNSRPGEGSSFWFTLPIYESENELANIKLLPPVDSEIYPATRG